MPTAQTTHETLLTEGATQFLRALHDQFEDRRQTLLANRRTRQTAWDAGETPGFLEETKHIRDGNWTVAPTPEALQDRRVEITGPVDRKMMINALNSGAKVFMGDFEDSLSPTWKNVMDGQQNVYDYARNQLTYEHPTKGTYQLGEKPAKLILRPRGWHLHEANFLVDGTPMSASLFDFGLTFYHNAKKLAESGRGPFYYLPKLEHYEEALLWDDVFRFAQNHIGLPTGTIKVTILIETLPAAFQMDEILHALREHIVGLNAGRWDYIFSCIKTLRNHQDKLLPDRGQVTMTVPHMRAYTELLISTCHRRGAFAMGGMSAFIPDRNDPIKTEHALQQVRSDKLREATEGCDGTWVAHPGLVQVATDIFDAQLGDKPNQVALQKIVNITQEDLLNFDVPNGVITIEGVRANIDVGLRYLIAWLSGNGAAAIHGLMEDAATAEISRSQIWQWTHADATLQDGTHVTRDLVSALLESSVQSLNQEFDASIVRRAADLFSQVALSDAFPDFLTLPAYEQLEQP